jgi:hypothetical protein
MSDPSAFGFGKFVPGFDFLQSLAPTAGQPAAAGAAVPGMASWVAPTLSVQEIDKRIQELKAVQFWLEQNATALKATIQALEVQKMTLSTLQGMNVNMQDLARAFTARPPASPAAAPATHDASGAPASTSSPAGAAARPATTARASGARSRTRSKARSDQAAAPVVDPLQWWGSLTQQFQNIAASALREAAAPASAAGDGATPAAAAPASGPATRKSGRSAGTPSPAARPRRAPRA